MSCEVEGSGVEVEGGDGVLGSRESEMEELEVEPEAEEGVGGGCEEGGAWASAERM